MTFQPVKIGVVGLGRFGRLHAWTVAALVEAELVALVARRQASLDSLAGELPGVRGWTNLDQAIRESGAQAWIVACTTASHVPVTRALLAAGKTVLLEKPVADNLDEARQLQSLVRPDSSNLMLGHIVLFGSEFAQLREEVQNRGKIAYIDCVRHRPATIVKQFPGENPLHATMVHDLYATQVLVDRAEPVHFSAQFHRTRQGQIDLALAQLKWANGPVASFAASYLTPAGMAPRGFDRMEVFGEGWSARINPQPATDRGLGIAGGMATAAGDSLRGGGGDRHAGRRVALFLPRRQRDKSRAGRRHLCRRTAGSGLDGEAVCLRKKPRRGGII